MTSAFADWGFKIGNFQSGDVGYKYVAVIDG